MSFRLLMHPTQARMEIEVGIALQELGYRISMSEHYDLKLPPNPYYLFREEITTWPDITLLDYVLLVYLDGWKVHLKREAKDKFLRKLLAEQYPVNVLPIHYKRYSPKRRREIVAEIVEAIR